MSKWSFHKKQFNDFGASSQIGSIQTPEGQWFAAVEIGNKIDEDDDMVLVRQVLKVLNRELPGGKPRNRKGKK